MLVDAAYEAVGEGGEGAKPGLVWLVVAQFSVCFRSVVKTERGQRIKKVERNVSLKTF